MTFKKLVNVRVLKDIQLSAHEGKNPKKISMSIFYLMYLKGVILLKYLINL